MGADESESRLTRYKDMNGRPNDSPMMLRPDASSLAGIRIESALRSELSVPYEIKEDESHLEYQAEQAEMHAKLANFLKFKAKSKELSRQFAAIASSQKGAPQLDIESDSDEDPAAKKKRQNMLSPNNGSKVTFDYKGKIIQVKDPKLEHMSQKINPDIIIRNQSSHMGLYSAVSKRSASVSTKSNAPSSKPIDANSSLVVQYEDELQRIYQERQAMRGKDNDSNNSNDS